MRQELTCSESELGRLYAAARNHTKYLSRMATGEYPYDEKKVKQTFFSMSRLEDKGITCRVPVRARRNWYIKNLSKLCDVYVKTREEDVQKDARAKCDKMLESVSKSKATYAPWKLIEAVLYDDVVFADDVFIVLALYLCAGRSIAHIKKKHREMFRQEEDDA